MGLHEEVLQIPQFFDRNVWRFASIELQLLARLFHELPYRERGDERATGQPQGLEFEAYLNSTSQGSRPEDGRRGGISTVVVDKS